MVENRVVLAATTDSTEALCFAARGARGQKLSLLRGMLGWSSGSWGGGQPVQPVTKKCSKTLCFYGAGCTGSETFPTKRQVWVVRGRPWRVVGGASCDQRRHKSTAFCSAGGTWLEAFPTGRHVGVGLRQVGWGLAGAICDQGVLQSKVSAVLSSRAKKLY